MTWPPRRRPQPTPSNANTAAIGSGLLAYYGGWEADVINTDVIDRDVLAALEELDEEEDAQDAQNKLDEQEKPVTDTVVSSATREVVIGFERPFVMIGEKINPTGRKLLAEEMKNGDFSRVEVDALAQVAAGAHMLDVNAGIPLADEPAMLARAITLVQSITDVPLSIDSSIIAALEAGLAVYQGKPLVNSVTGEEEVLERVMPLVAKYGAAVVAISNDETGISMDPDVRFEVAKRIVERAADFGIPASDVIVDPLVMPIGALGQAGPARLPTDPPPARRAEGQHHLRCIQRQLRPAEPSSGHRHVPGDGDRRRHDVGDHEPDAPGGEGRGDGRRCAGRAGQGLRGVDPRQPRSNRRLERARQPASPAERVDPMPRIVFTPSGLTGEVDTGTTVLTAARQLGVDLDSVCGGRGICGRCQIEPSTGSFAKWAIDSTADGVVGLVVGRGRLRDEGQRPPTAARGSPPRLRGDGSRRCRGRRRAVREPGAQAGGAQVGRPHRSGDRSAVHAVQRRRAEGGARRFRIGHRTDRRGRRSYARRRRAHLEHDRAARRPSRLPRTTRAPSRSRSTATAWPSPSGRASSTPRSGVAIDVGSTTVAGHLCDLSTGEVLATAGIMNPQIRFGEDLMSRVSYVMMNPGGDKELTACIRAALNELITDLLRQADSPADELLDIVIVGNPIMHHIVLGIDPTPLGQAPFTLATAEAIRTTALDLGLRLSDGARVPGSVHRRSRRRRHDGGHARRGPAPRRGVATAGRRRHQRRDRPRVRRATVRRIEPHRPGVRRCPDLVRSTGNGRRDRTCPHRSHRRWRRASRSSAATCGATIPVSPRQPSI